jgi:hypothetical protein
VFWTQIVPWRDSLHGNENLVLAHKVISISPQNVFILKVIVVIPLFARDSDARANQRRSDSRIDKIARIIRMKPKEDKFTNACCEQVSIVAEFGSGALSISDGCKSDSFHSCNWNSPRRRNHINLHSLSFIIIVLLCCMGSSKYWGCPSEDHIPLFVSGFPNLLSQ